MIEVTIDEAAEDRLWAFIRAVDVEVGGMGYARLDGATIHWHETFLIPQEVSSTEVDFEITNGDEVAVEKALTDGVLSDPSFIWVSWHSHHKMKPYWSATDDERIEGMRAVGMKRLLSLVGCHDGTYRMRLDCFDFQAHGIPLGQVTLDKLEFVREEVPEVEPTEFEKQIAAELEANVKKQKTFGFAYSTGSTGKSLVPMAGSLQEIAEAMTDSDRDEFLPGHNPSRDFDETERRVVNELVAMAGFTRADAEGCMREYGLDECEGLLDEADRRKRNGKETSKV